MAKNQNTFTLGTLMIESHGKGKPVTLTIGKEKADVEYKELWGVVYLLGSQKHKSEMIPVQKKEMMQFVRKYRIQAKKDIKEGEEIVFWAEINVSETVVNSIAKENGAKVIREQQVPE